MDVSNNGAKRKNKNWKRKNKLKAIINGTNMAKQKKKGKGRQPPSFNEQPEDFRVDIDRVIRDFISDPDMNAHAFPAGLSNLQRAYVHERARKFGLKSKSSGSEPNRFITISKKVQAEKQEFFDLIICDASKNVINSLLRKNEKSMEFDTTIRSNFHDFTHSNYGRLNVVMTALVDPPISSPLRSFRESLPVYEYRNPFLQLLEINQVLLITAETGSGKTTQIPQYILETCCEKRQRCRIICTQPRRISTIAVAERVAQERGEKVGHTVGYQIKLESKLGIKTSLIYCTTGVLLRTLMGGDECCNNITHIIVDEIHERDKFSDFLLICLKQCIQNYPHLRLILMSATMDSDLYTKYFDNKVYTMFIPGRTYSVTQLFLDDILPLIGYETPAMKALKIIQEKNIKQNAKPPLQVCQDVAQAAAIDNDLLSEMESVLLECMRSGSDDCFAHIMQLILCDGVSVNTAEKIKGYSPVIVAAAHGNVEMLEQLINLGGDLNHTSNDGLSALDWAQYCGQNDVIQLIKASEIQISAEQSQESDVLKLYNKSVPEDNIDYNLIVALIEYIHENVDKLEGILVFLPGYEDIMNCFDCISNSKLNMNEIKLCILHGSMQIKAQHEVFKEYPNKQKIILSTNVAETSITIDGVRFVIDSGKAKQKTYDSISGSSAMQTSWISMACVKQRAGRAGRTQSGVCFHVFSKVRYDSFLFNTIPEILRVPLHELCLHTKMLAPDGISIAEFLSYAIEPPPLATVKKAVERLQSLGALTKDEDLTPLGTHLLQLSVEPHLGKMLIYSIIFKCLDPVLTIVSSLAHKEPFALPPLISQRSLANARKHSFSSGSLSDHMGLLKAFQDWQQAKVKHREHRFCTENFLSPAAMEMIMLTRTQLLGQLRAAGFVQVNHRENIQELNTYSENWPLVKAALAAGLYPNVAFSKKQGLYTKTEKKVAPHASSCLKNDLVKYVADKKFLWVVFEEMSKLGRVCNIRCGTAITPTTVSLTCGSFLDFEPNENFLTIDNLIVFRVNDPEMWEFRKCLDNLIQKKIKCSNSRQTNFDDQIIETLSFVLSLEDSSQSLTYPTGIGEKPKLIYKPRFEYRGPTERYTQQNNFPIYQQQGYQSTSNSTRHYNNNYNRNSFASSSNWQFNADESYDQCQQQQSRVFKSGQHPYHRFNNSNNQRLQNPQLSYPCNSATNLVNVMAPRSLSIPENARFFFIKPAEVRNVIISISQGTWTFSPQTEKKLFRLLNEGCYIVLFFTVRGTTFIQGVAHLLDTNMGIPNRPCHIEWLGTNSISFNKIKHMVIPRIHIVEDGQEINCEVGHKICAMLMENSDYIKNNFRPILGNKQN